MAETIINRGQLDNKNWTRDNLLAGDNISITEVQKPVIDANTIGLWHFDEDTIDVIANNTINAANLNFTDITGHYKFTKALAFKLSGISYAALTTPITLTKGTLDFWVYLNGSNSFFQFTQHQDSYYGITVRNGSVYYNNTVIYSGVSTGAIHHIAVSFKARDNKTYVFACVDGVKGQETELTGFTTFQFTHLGVRCDSTGLTNTGLDELRVSNVVRWDADFTPFDQPYAAAGGAAQYQINAISSGSTPITAWFKNNTGTTLDTQLSNIVEVYKNGLLLEPEDSDDVNDYSISGTVITFTTALTTEDKVTVKYTA